MAEITPQGIQIKTQNEWFEEERERYLAIDPLWNFDPSVPDGLKHAIDAEVWANLSEMAHAAYNAKDLDNAVGNAIDILANFFNLPREEGSQSTAVIQVTGILNTVIPAGSVVISSVDGSRWTTDTTLTIVDTPDLTIGVTAEQLGAISASVNTLTVIGSSIPGWQTVTNPAAAILGTYPEEDNDFKRRINNLPTTFGANQIDSLQANIARVPGVTRVIIYENDTDSTDSNDIEANSIAIFVQGGLPADIALQVARFKSPGYGQNRTNTDIGTPIVVNTNTPKGRNFSAVIFRPIEVDVFIEVDITEVGDLPSNIIDQVREYIIDFVVFNLFRGEVVTGFFRGRFDISNDIPPASLYIPVNKLLGLLGDSYVTEIRVGSTSSNESTNSLVLDFNELAVFDAANIAVNVT